MSTTGRAPRWTGTGVTTDIRLNGIRNAAQTTVAPTGTIATVAGCEGYGCEPVFALAYIRHVNDNGKDLQLTYTSPLFEEALIGSGLDEETRASDCGAGDERGHLPERVRDPAGHPRRVRRLAGHHRRGARAHAGRPAGLRG